MSDLGFRNVDGRNMVLRDPDPTKQETPDLFDKSAIIADAKECATAFGFRACHRRA